MSASVVEPNSNVSAPSAIEESNVAYRPEVDGLRGVAILGVLLYHANPAWLTGGFAGVDVFFVISGFLISGIIARSLAKSRFTIVDFYIRRIRRVFPALLAMLLTVRAVAWFVFLRDEYETLGTHMIASAGFALNLLLFHDLSDYVALTTSPPLLHLWSLGVEEQFYIIWPVLNEEILQSIRLSGVAVVGCASFFLNIAVLPDGNSRKMGNERLKIRLIPYGHTACAAELDVDAIRGSESRWRRTLPDLGG